MWTLVAFSEYMNTVTTLTKLAAVPDQTHKTVGDDLYVGKWNNLIGLYLAGIGTQEGYVISPSLRRFSRIYAYPLNQIGSSDMNRLRRFDNRITCPVPLDIGEALNAFMRDSQPSTASADMMGVWLADAPVTPIVGDVRTIQFISHNLAAEDYLANIWHNEEIDFTPDLPVGRYAIVGARCHAKHTGLFRFVSREMANRPGGILTNDLNWVDDEVFHLGRMGTWLEFDSVLPPSLDVLQAHDESGTDVFGNIDLIKVA